MSNPLFDQIGQVAKRRTRAIDKVAKATKPKVKSEFQKIVDEAFAPVGDPQEDQVKKAQAATGPSTFRKVVTPSDKRSASQTRKEQAPGSFEASFSKARREMPKKMTPEDEQDFKSAVWILSEKGDIDPKALKELTQRFRKDKSGVKAEVAEFRAKRDTQQRIGATGEAGAMPEMNEFDRLQEDISFIFAPVQDTLGKFSPAGALATLAGPENLQNVGQSGVDAVGDFVQTPFGQKLSAAAVNPLIPVFGGEMEKQAAALGGGALETIPSMVADLGRMNDPSLDPRRRTEAGLALFANVATLDFAAMKAVPGLVKGLKEAIPWMRASGVADDAVEAVAKKIDEFVPQEAAGYDPGVVPDLKAGLDEVPPGPPPANQLNPTQKPSPSNAGADGFSGGKADVKAIDDELGDVYHGTDSGGANGDLPRNGQGSAIPGERPAGQGQGDVVTSRTAEVAPKSPRVADIERDLADVLPKNHAVKDVFETDGGTVLADVRRTLDSGGYIDTRISIAPDGTVKHVSSHHWYKTAGMRAWEQVPYKKPNWVVGAESQKYTPTAPTSPALAPDVPVSSADAVPIHKADPTFGANNKITTRSRLEEALAELNGSGPGVAGSGLGGLDDVGRKFNAVVDVAAFYVEAGVREIPELVKALRAAIGPNVSDDDIMRAAKKATGQAEDVPHYKMRSIDADGEWYVKNREANKNFGDFEHAQSVHDAAFNSGKVSVAQGKLSGSLNWDHALLKKDGFAENGYFIVHDGDVAVGVINYDISNGVPHINNADLRKGLRGKGVGVKMYEALLTELNRMGYKDVDFGIISSTEARNVHEALKRRGYSFTGKRVATAIQAPDVPPAKPPKAAESAVPDEPVKPQGVSHAEVDDLRKEMGWTPRDPAKAKPDADLAADAKKLEGDESAIADKVLGDAENKVTLGDEEAVALGKKLTSLKQRMLAAKAANDVDAFDLADAQAQKIADALDLSGTRQGRAFRARRFLFKDQEDAWTLNRRARKANQDQPLDTKQQANLDKRIKELEEANAALAKERDDAIKSLSDSRNNPRPSRNGPLTSQKRRSAALNSLRKLGITVADDTVGAASGGMKSKRSGAINIPQGSTEQVARAIRGLVRSYADTGISKWDDVLAKLKADLPGIDEEQALFILSGKYKVAKVEADLAKKAVNKFMSNVQADAVYRTKPLVKKVLHHAFELFNTGQRSLQTSLDNSLALIQGKNVLMSRPGTWMKGVGKSLQTLAKKDPLEFARRHMAEIENNPLYAKAVQAKLGLSDVDGSYSHQEEFFAGKFQDMVPGLSHSKAMATTLMNTMRWDLFRKMTANLKADAPAEAYEDIARYINVLTGKGDGKIAEWLGGKPAGIVSYAPRFYLSKVQHNIGQPIWAAKTAAGRKQVLKGYAQQMAGYGSALAAAEAFGWDVDLDPRSATFGKASKDGVSFDLFYQQSEGVRVMAQFTYGRISQKGQYKAPGDYGDYSMGDYIESKSSPLIKTAFRAATGKTYDYDEGKTRDVVASDYWGNFIPLSIQEMYKNKDIPMSPAGIAASTAASFMGGGVAKVKPKTTSKKTIPPLVTDPIVKPVEDIIKGLINKK